MNVEEYAKKYLALEITEIEGSRINDHHELSLYEKALIYKYSNDGYEDLNEYLRISKGENNDYGKLLNKCLNKLPNFEGLVYRCVNLTAAEVQIYIDAENQNKVVTEHPFVSTSKSELTANAYGRNVKFVIYSKTGKEIEKFAKFGLHNPHNEKEVLFKSGRSFNVLEVTKDRGYTLIITEEV
ncbi:MAG: ADP-ribosyltransferase [Daejeonella sp.]